MASELRMDVQPYGDGTVLLTLGSLSLTLDTETRDQLRELLDRAAMPGQAGAAGIRPGYLACAHCGGEIAPCKGGALPVCKGWIHTAYAAAKPVGAHYCEGRSINPSAEPAPGDIARRPEARDDRA